MTNSTFNLTNLNGSNGFVLPGLTSGDSSGFSVSNAGDINGDGIDDLIIGAIGAGPMKLAKTTWYLDLALGLVPVWT